MLRGLVSLLCVLTAVAATGAFPEAAPAAPANPASGAGPLPFFYDLYTFRGDRTGTAVVAAFAVPAGALHEEQVGGKVRYRFDVTLVLADTALRTVHRTDNSVFVASPRSLPDDHLLYTQVEMRAPPSTSTVHRVIMTDASTPGIGQLFDARFRIPDYSGSHLMLSDIALGQPEVEGGWSRGGVSLALLPTSQFPQSAFEVYYEIYNLPRGNRYATEIAIEHLPDGRRGRAEARAPIRLRFAGESAAEADGMVEELRRVETSLDRGRYRLTVTITDETTGQTAHRSRVFRVRGWGRGATMVAALPRTAPPVR